MSIRILVVDDELDTLNLMRTILEISGYRPITTLNSVEAIALAEIENPDVILLDIMMPKLDGFTLCKMMRQKEATKHLPIIFVTAYESLDIEERRVEAGADMIIQKPIDMDELIKAVKNASLLRARAEAQTKPSNGNEAVAPPSTTAVTAPLVSTTSVPSAPPAAPAAPAQPDSDQKK